MKRLFMLRRGGNRAPIVGDTGLPLYFSDKMAAKAARDQLGDGAVVSYGPDHTKFVNTKHGVK